MSCPACAHENPARNRFCGGWAQDREGQNVVVLCEAGVGKSRLVYQLHEHLAAVPHTWLECFASGVRPPPPAAPEDACAR